MPARMNTERSTLRNFQSDDGEALYAMIVQYQASEMAAYDQQWPASREEIQEIMEWFARGDDFLAVCLKDTGQFIGFVGLNPEQAENGRVFNLGYVFDANFHGQGYATEACRAVLGRAFGLLRADRVVTATAAVNHPSRRLLERLGFVKTGEATASFRNDENGKPIEFTGVRYALSRDAWESHD